MVTAVRDVNNGVIPILRPVSTENIASDGVLSTKAAALSTGTTVVRLVSPVAFYFSVEGSATSDATYVPADTVEYIRIEPTDEIHVLGTTAGAIYVTEMI